MKSSSQIPMTVSDSSAGPPEQNLLIYPVKNEGSTFLKNHSVRSHLHHRLRNIRNLYGFYLGRSLDCLPCRLSYPSGGSPEVLYSSPQRIHLSSFLFVHLLNHPKYRHRSWNTPGLCKIKLLLH